MNTEALRKQAEEAIKDLTKNLIDDGQLIEAGWVGYLIACKIKGAPEDQLREMRQSFYAGAMHLMGSMMSFLEPGAEPTETDMVRMTGLMNELQRFRQQLEERIKHTP